MAGSISFDRAAEIYDDTRVTDEASIGAGIAVLDEVLDRDPLLEIGVGTGALAVPLVVRGRGVVGVDLASAMLSKLQAKDGHEGVALAIADATRLPFHDGAFGGAYCRWVLHLISAWRDAVRELCRVVGVGGVIVIEPGGYTGDWATVWTRFVEELGPAAEPVGLDLRGGYVDLDEVFRSNGGVLREVVETPGSVDSSLERFFNETLERTYSWTWRVPDDELRRAVDVVRPWAMERFGGDLDAPFAPDAPHRWRVYDLRG